MPLPWSAALDCGRHTVCACYNHAKVSAIGLAPSGTHFETRSVSEAARDVHFRLEKASLTLFDVARFESRQGRYVVAIGREPLISERWIE